MIKKTPQNHPFCFDLLVSDEFLLISYKKKQLPFKAQYLVGTYGSIVFSVCTFLLILCNNNK